MKTTVIILPDDVVLVYADDMLDEPPTCKFCDRIDVEFVDILGEILKHMQKE